MAGSIVLFGATGYTGELTAHALVGMGERPILAGRDPLRLEELAATLGLGEIRVADVDQPASVAKLVGDGDVLLTTVGPFTRWGDAAVDAAIRKRATYIDSTGEPLFIEKVFTTYSKRAVTAEVALIPACAFDYVPGQVAGSLALQRAGAAARRIDVGYFPVGPARRALSAGTRASVASVAAVTPRVWRDGKLVRQSTGAKTRSFTVEGRSRAAFSIGASEHFALPRQFPQLTEVNVFLGWIAGGGESVARAGTVMLGAAGRIPGMARFAGALAGRGSRGPDADARAASGVEVVAIAYDGGGEELATVRLHGPNAYDYTGSMLGWAAQRALRQGVDGTGALGPVEAFGVTGASEGCAFAGLVEA